MRAVTRFSAIVGIVCAMTFLSVASSPNASADDTFSVQVEHHINGKSLGLSKSLPVIATVNKDGIDIAALNLSFGDVVKTDLPSGEYTITITSVEAGPLPSMTVGPVDIPAGVSVRLQAKLSANKTPIVAVK
jgi:hypothetical protein